MSSREHIYGRNAVLEALQAGRRVVRILVAQGAHGEPMPALHAAARTMGTPVRTVDRRELDRLVGDRHHQGVVAEVEPFAYASLDDVFVRAEQRGEPPLLLLVDSVQDPQNLGTLIRSAYAAGTHGVILPEHRAASITPAVVRASAGTASHLPIVRVVNVARTLQQIKDRGVWAYGLAANGVRSYRACDWRSACVLVVGSEGAGLGRLVRATCDEVVRIPMAAATAESLNVAIAGSLALFEALHQRQEAPSNPVSG